jgi:hypothetical protein
MKNLFAIMLILFLVGGLLAQQTQPASTDKPKNEFDPNKPTIVFYADVTSAEIKDFIQAITVGIKANFAIVDISQEEGFAKFRNILSQYKVQNIQIAAVVYKNNESDIMFGAKDISENLPGFYRHYSNPEIFPEKPKLNYAKQETISDKFNSIESKFMSKLENILAKIEEYKDNFDKTKKNINESTEGQSDDQSLVTMIFMFLLSIIYGYEKIKKKIAGKKN